MATKRILVVEDEEKIRQLLHRFLEPDYDVLVAEDGRRAVELAKAHRPNLILLDIRLPKLNGLDVLRLLKMSEDTVSIPVVILSGIGESGSLLDAEMLGAVDYLIKPFDLNDVRDMVQRYLVLWKDARPPGGRKDERSA